MASSNERYLAQIGALSDRFHVTGKVTLSNELYHVQLGLFQNR
ncbi:MAG: hypothetical protein ACSLEN_11785 [Candidatus Malihini olakiniferum]